MHGDLARKLRLTAAALGCATRKDLCARFRHANPATQVDVERLGKWMQGRASPRDGGVYADWIKVIGSSRPPAWLRDCSPEALHAELAGLLGADALPAAALPPRPAEDQPGIHLLGAYACYSPAWSPYSAGRLIRGSLGIAPGRRGGLAVTYTETLLGRPTSFGGEAVLASALHLPLREARSGLPLFLSLLLARPPASVLAGVMAGPTMVGPEPRPSCCRFVAVRVSATAPLEATNRYLAVGEGIAGDLVALGIPAGLARPAGAALDALLREPAAGGLAQVTVGAQAGLAALLDPAWLAGEAAAAR